MRSLPSAISRYSLTDFIEVVTDFRTLPKPSHQVEWIRECLIWSSCRFGGLHASAYYANPYLS